MNHFYQGLLFLHGHIADPRIFTDAPKPAATVAKPAAVAKAKQTTRKRAYGSTPRAA